MARKSNEFRFLPGASERLAYYVYALVDPRNKKPFYIGKGKGNRMFGHSCAEEQRKKEQIKDIERAGLKVGRVVICHGLNEREAFGRETTIIVALQHAGIELVNKNRGVDCRSVWLYESEVNARYGAKEVTLTEPCILVSLKKTYTPSLSDRELMQATCGEWPFGEGLVTGTSRALRAKYILGIYEGVVRTAYQIDHSTWKRVSSGRWKCRGLPAPRSMSKLVGNADVRKHLPVAQWSFTYGDTVNQVRKQSCAQAGAIS